MLLRMTAEERERRLAIMRREHEVSTDAVVRELR
jgi:hypothetical protein